MKERKKVHIVSTSLILLFFLLVLPILFYLIYFLFFSRFSLKHMFGYSQSQQQWEITHCCQSYSQEVKHIAVNRLSIGEAGKYSKEHTKKKVCTG